MKLTPEQIKALKREIASVIVSSLHDHFESLNGEWVIEDPAHDIDAVGRQKLEGRSVGKAVFTIDVNNPNTDDDEPFEFSVSEDDIAKIITQPVLPRAKAKDRRKEIDIRLENGHYKAYQGKIPLSFWDEENKRQHDRFPDRASVIRVLGDNWKINWL